MQTLIDTVVITPEEAKNILDTQMFNRQRKVKPSHVRKLSRVMVQGDFLPNSVITRATVDKLAHVYVDGRQRLTAVYESDKPQTFIRHTVIVDTPEQIAKLYQVLDSHSPRTNKDRLRAAGMAEKLDIPDTYLTYAMAALNQIATGFKPHNSKLLHYFEMESQLPHYLDEMKWFFEKYPSIELAKDSFHRAAVLSLILLTLKHDRANAEEFWPVVMNGLSDDPTDPRLLAHKHIIATAINAGGRKKKKVVTAAEQARYIAATWNQFISGEKGKKLKIVNPLAPINILNTPFEITKGKKKDESQTTAE